MKNVMRLTVLAGLMCLQTMATDCYYLTNGSGTWADATRWSGGHVPESGDVVRITNGTARVTAADLPILEQVYATVVVNKGDVLEFDIDVDYHHPTRIIGKGKVVKNGSGALYLDEKFSKLYNTDGGMEVNDGELHLVEVDTTDQNEFMYGPFVVNAPGKLFLRPGGTSSTPGISGDGLITNISTTAQELYLITNVTANAGRTYSFSGIVSPKVQLTVKGTERQDMLADNPYALTVRAATGVIGVKKFGDAGAVGSIGTANNIWINSSSTLEAPRFLYLGDEGETTSKSFRMNTSPRGVVFDGGANGGLKLTGDFYLTRNLSTMTQLILDGSNTTACTFASKALEHQTDTALATHIVKRGTGTWRLNAVNSTELRGGITVEKGTLEAQTIANAGTQCALGKATVLQSAYWGAKDASKNVPWAILLGDGTMPDDLTHAGTLSYVGISAVDCSTRLIALNGAGRLRNGSAVALKWSGVTSSCVGDHALVLDGSGASDEAFCVTNGPGRITVVKEGVGTWTLDRDLDVSGFDVRGGTLDVRVSRRYAYYRFNVKELWGAEELSVQVSRIALFAEDGTCRNLGLTENTGAVGAPALLQPGQFAYWTSGYVGGRPLENVFVENDGENDICTVYNSAAGSVPILADDSTWIRFIMRPESGAAITRYDICAGTVNGSGSTPYKREIKTWSIEGSQDGVTWKELSAVTNNPNASIEKLVWYSNRSTTRSATDGYAIAAEGTDFVKPTQVDFISVASNGTLKVDKPLVAGGICCDIADGGGTVQGFAFPAAGTLRVTGAGKDMILLPITFTDCTGLANLSNWALYLDGQRVTTRRIRVTSGGRVYVTSRGFGLSFR